MMANAMIAHISQILKKIFSGRFIINLIRNFLALLGHFFFLKHQQQYNYRTESFTCVAFR